MGLELWGGVECTVNRVAGRHHDQVRRSGHHDRLDDLDRFASLGLTAIRYPVLWERVAPGGVLADADWSWSDERLGRLRELGIRPIVGLLHHGSGPCETGLLDQAFPKQLAAFAAAVANRYPWIDDYTPVNEPLTTGRFSALYGHWYPHRRDDEAFATALVNQIKATVLAMQAVREVNPRARLVQTEDAGWTFSTPALAHQAEFENQRRWLTFDFLAGHVTGTHPLWSWLRGALAGEADLEWLATHPCPADVVGLNYYLTSDRFLDERLDLYPEWTHGSNGRQRYADVELVRADAWGIRGHRSVLAEAWARYRVPVAITEVHAGCSREEQLRWTMEAWQGALAARQDGADVQAVTLWALLGSLDWNSLLTRTDGTYEPGVFDIRSAPPRPTAIATLARQLSAGVPTDPIAREPGWWRRPGRVTCGPGADLETPVPASGTPKDRRSEPWCPRTLVITGAQGTLGSAFARAAQARGLAVAALSRHDLDITDASAVEGMLAHLRPWAVVNAAGYVRVDAAEADPPACLKLNADGAAALAQACADAGTRLVTFSSDLVFDGALLRPYVESDQPRPLSIYGISKAEAETRVLAACPHALVIRTSAFFGPADDANFITLALRALAAGRPFEAAEDTVVSPTYVPDLVDATLDLLVDGEAGIWHLVNDGQVSWYELALMTARKAGLDAGLVRPARMGQIAGPAPRPVFSALASSRGTLLPSLDHALDRYIGVAPYLRPSEADAVAS